MQEASGQEIKLGEVSVAAFRVVLRYLYTVEVPASGEGRTGGPVLSRGGGSGGTVSGGGAGGESACFTRANVCERISKFVALNECRRRRVTRAGCF